MQSQVDLRCLAQARNQAFKRAGHVVLLKVVHSGGEDELPEICMETTCPMGQSLCGDGVTCISEEQFCDGVAQCPDGLDEAPEECVSPCPNPNEWPCGETTTCIPEEAFCDGTPDCPGGEDESPEECSGG